MAAFDRLETWAAGFLLVQPMMADLGVSGSEGVEEVLKARFAASQRPIGELETVETATGLHRRAGRAGPARLSSKASSTKASDVRKEFADMLAAWARGDEKAIADSFGKELKASPGLRDALLTRRNANWAAEIEAKLDSTPGTILIAVGAGHLAGPNSVQKMLAARGLVITRVQ